MHLNASVGRLGQHRGMTNTDALAQFGLFDRNVPRYTSYPPATQFREIPDPSITERWLSELDPREPISLYAHVPFCRRVCWFCACRTQGLGNDGRLDTYLDVLTTEVERIADLLPNEVKVSRLHFGGGTPTLLSPDQLTRLMTSIRDAFSITSDAEFSVEIDPNEIDAARLDALMLGGLNRASIGVQDFDPLIQKAIGREQSYEVTRDAVQLLRERGIGSLNADILYGLPHQTEARLVRSIEQLVSLSPDRVALYGYAHVPWVAKRQVMIPDAALPSTEARFELSELARETFESHGYVAIGIDHFALPTDGLALAKNSGHLRRNFQGYTDDTAPTLIGLGASAISKLPQGYVQNDPGTGGYQDRIRAAHLAGTRGHGFGGEDLVRARAVEMLLCDFAIDLDRLESEGHTSIETIASTAALVAAHFSPWVNYANRRLTLQSDARPLARIVAQWFDAYEVASTAHSSAI